MNTKITLIIAAALASSFALMPAAAHARGLLSQPDMPVRLDQFVADIKAGLDRSPHTECWPRIRSVPVDGLPFEQTTVPQFVPRPTPLQMPVGLGNFCVTPVGRFGPGDVQPIGTPCVGQHQTEQFIGFVGQ